MNFGVKFVFLFECFHSKITRVLRHQKVFVAPPSEGAVPGSNVVDSQFEKRNPTIPPLLIYGKPNARHSTRHR